MRFIKIIKNIFSFKKKNPKSPYPGLEYKEDEGKGIWEGEIYFVARHDSIRVKDAFKIRIEMPDDPEGLPLVKEIGGRIEKILSQGKAENKADLHVNPSGEICLCPRPEQKRRFPGEVDLSIFVKELVIPYFSALSYFEKTGKWFLGQYSHGALGIMEYYLENREKSNPQLIEDCKKALGIELKNKIDAGVQFNGREPCLCGSRKKFKKCHPSALSGLKAIIEDNNKPY